MSCWNSNELYSILINFLYFGSRIESQILFLCFHKNYKKKQNHHDIQLT